MEVKKFVVDLNWYHDDGNPLTEEYKYDPENPHIYDGTYHKIAALGKGLDDIQIPLVFNPESVFVTRNAGTFIEVSHILNDTQNPDAWEVREFKFTRCLNLLRLAANRQNLEWKLLKESLR